MGRQIAFYMVSEDCKEFLAFVQKRDPVFVIPFNAGSSEVKQVQSPCDRDTRGRYCLWNQSLLSSFSYEFVPKSDAGPYYTTKSRAPVLEFSWGPPVEWSRRPSLLQHRVWCSFEYRGEKTKDLERWFNRIVRWIRKNYYKNPSHELDGYVGPAALEWFKNGGYLLGTYLPPTPASKGWLQILARQDRAREEILKLESMKPRSSRSRR